MLTTVEGLLAGLAGQETDCNGWLRAMNTSGVLQALFKKIDGAL